MFLIRVRLNLVALCSTLVNLCCVLIFIFLNMLLNKLAGVYLVSALDVTKG